MPKKIFKTPDRGWGVRATDFIPEGTFLARMRLVSGFYHV
jgi:hypothetical protein